MDIENKTLEILDLVREKVLSPDEALPHIFRLFSVVGRSEQLQGFFEFYKNKFGGGFNTDVLEITLKQYQETL
jgi:hypothetical protein